MIDRIVYINQRVEITAHFSENGSVIQPADPVVYPLWVVKDPYDNVVDSGVGTLNQNDNLYHAVWTVPEDATISTDTAKWKLEWEILGTNGKRYKIIELFDVANPNFDKTSIKEQQKLILTTIDSEISVPVPGIPSKISFVLADINGNQIWSPSNPPENKGMYGDYYIYSVNIPANTVTSNTEYLGIWNINLGGNTNTFIVKIFGASPYEISLVSDLRAFLDKSLKPADIILGYKDSELLNYIYRGLQTINNLPPPTNWTLNTIRTAGLNSVLILAAAWWGLDVQYLAEADLMYNYSGQSISLDSDRTGFIESEKSRIWEYLDGTFKIQKKQICRQGDYGNVAIGVALPTTGGGGINVKIPVPLIIG